MKLTHPKICDINIVLQNTSLEGAPVKLRRETVLTIVNSALKEDIGPLDITTSAIVPKEAKVRADILAKEDGISCGLLVCEAVFDILSKDIRFKPQVNEGDLVHEGKVLCYMEGPARPILTGERTALNFLAKLSGIATETSKFVEQAKPYGVKIMDTRKTTPGLRYLEKYAVKAGGGYNHRMGLWDQILIKDNHLKIAHSKERPLDRLLEDVRKKVQKNVRIEIEVGTLREFEEALKGNPDIIMLDNMVPDDIKKAVNIRNKDAKGILLEVSGNINLENIQEYAKCKPDVISIGSITHSARSLDVSLEVYGSV